MVFPLYDKTKMIFVSASTYTHTHPPRKSFKMKTSGSSLLTLLPAFV